MSAATVWSAGATLSVGDIIAPTSSNTGLFFRVTVGGQTGSSEPSWPSTIGETVYDLFVRYVSISSVASDLQVINPSAIIELFTLKLDSSLHGANTTYRFHTGSKSKDLTEIVWAGNSYQRLPVTAEGFAFRKGQLPRPRLIVSNALGTITSILNTVNNTTTGNDLTGATVTRIRTLAKFLDAVNFTGNTNPFGTPDPNAEFPKEVYKIDRKANENREIVEFELAAPTDLAGIRIPGRQCTRKDFPSIGTFS